ncbi:unnamed protein product [Psylliodes chrysocephalus]|uniref:Uncharacterized protein n=1 Tax=Psylliodes chrysocephalus TaxID=3402493 RepID=A0A9P0DCE3_9CUCU|nr:unnamed protein product [Psylliodes chrysocephala]
MTEAVIKKLLEENSKKLIDVMESNKTELKNALSSCETRLQSSIELESKKVRDLEEENFKLKNKVEQLEITLKRNNIIIFGLKKTNNTINLNFIIDIINKLFDISLIDSDISNFYSLGRDLNAPLKIEFCSYLKKKSILLNSNKLKNTGVFVADDLTELQRAQYKQLKEYLLKYMEEGKHCFIRGNKLILENTSYSLDDLDSLKTQKIDSAPSTPGSSSDPFNIQLEDKPTKQAVAANSTISKLDKLGKVHQVPVVKKTTRSTSKQ